MLKNYTSNSRYTFENIQKTLIAHHAKQISFEYIDNGKIKTLIFVLSVNGKDFGFKLPARVEQVKALFDREGYRYDPEQPYKTAWANIRDWIDAQMALIDTGQVKIEEAFLPYMVDSSGQTYFEHLEKKQFLLEGGESK